VLTALVCTGIAIAVWIRDLANPFVQSRNALPEFIFLLVVALVALIAPIGIRATATFLVRISASGDNSCVHVARDGSKAGQDLYIEFVLAVNRAIDACLERADTGGSKGLV